MPLEHNPCVKPNQHVTLPRDCSFQNSRFSLVVSAWFWSHTNGHALLPTSQANWIESVATSAHQG